MRFTQESAGEKNPRGHSHCLCPAGNHWGRELSDRGGLPGGNESEKKGIDQENGDSKEREKEQRSCQHQGRTNALSKQEKIDIWPWRADGAASPGQ